MLSEALNSIASQSLPKNDFEVIVVDNGSADGTKDVAGQFKLSMPNLRYVYLPYPGLHEGRNAGYAHAEGDVLVFADDDIVAFPTWLEAIARMMNAHDDVMMVGGKILPKYETEPPFWILEQWYELCQYGQCMAELSLADFGDNEKAISAEAVYGCNFAVRKSVLDATKGFHPDGFPFSMVQFRGDGETYVGRFVDQRGWKAMYVPDAAIYHQVPALRLTEDYFRKRAFCQGIEMSYCDLRYGNLNVATAKRSFKVRLKQLLGSSNSEDSIRLHAESQMTDLEKNILHSRQIGYQYHRHMYAEHEHIREWVHRQDYLDAHVR